jgi:hypothetical protein
MKPHRVIDTEELDKVRKCIDEIESRAMTSSCFCQTIPYTMELDQKYKKVLDYINNNPNITKQNVVDAFKNEAGFSRRVIFKILKELVESKLVLVEVDPVNNREHHLFVNHNVPASLIVVLEYFKKLYLELIYKTKPIIDRRRNAEGITPVELVEYLMMIYKFTRYKFSDFFLWHRKSCDNHTLHRKFAIINASMQETVTELYWSLVDTNFISRNEEMERFLNYSRFDVLSPENLTFIISTFEKCGLRKHVEPIIDLLWRLLYRKLPLLYLEYSHLSRDGKLNDWKDIVKGDLFINVPYKKKVYSPN